jgi:hypothetical protein
MTTKPLTAGERLALLKEQHGTLYKALKATNEYTYVAYDSDGNILYKGTETPRLEDDLADCKLYKFKTADTKIIDDAGKSIAQFMIEEDEHDVCHIKLKTIETATLKSNRDFLSEVTHDTADADITFDYTDTEWAVIINNITIKQDIVAYITPEKDPHILLERVVFPKDNLTENRIVVKRKSPVVSPFSMYVHKIDKSYSRKA